MTITSWQGDQLIFNTREPERWNNSHLGHSWIALAKEGGFQRILPRQLDIYFDSPKLCLLLR